MKFKILGVSASLRNARRQAGSQCLVEELSAIHSKPELLSFLKQQAALHLANFKEAGRTEHLPFDELYRNLRKLKGDRGMSNSEVALGAALWSAQQLGADIDHLSLSEYFLENGRHQNIDELKQRLLAADGLILSTPVYFGDRSSLAQFLMDLIRDNVELRNGLRGKVYVGVAVGAKRNGGQETTLIYQLLDMVNCDLLGVGNDSETTSQYGGTGHAGDIGTMPDDIYGLDTSMGAGRRIARVVAMLGLAGAQRLVGRPKVAFWILQDKDEQALHYLQQLLSRGAFEFDADILDLSGRRIVPCLACDVCPTHIDVDESYRCIIKNKTDAMPSVHRDLIDVDAIIPVALSPVDRSGLVTNYQTFIERTRYLRRGDYVFSDLLCAPLVLEELGSGENLSIRMVTSMIRHHTIIMKPMLAFRHNGVNLNEADIEAALQRFGRVAANVTLGRLLAYSANVEHLKYHPVGYVLSAVKDQEDQKMKRRGEMVDDRVARARRDPRLPLLQGVADTC